VRHLLLSHYAYQRANRADRRITIAAVTKTRWSANRGALAEPCIRRSTPCMRREESRARGTSRSCASDNDERAVLAGIEAVGLVGDPDAD